VFLNDIQIGKTLTALPEIVEAKKPLLIPWSKDIKSYSVSKGIELFPLRETAVILVKDLEISGGAISVTTSDSYSIAYFKIEHRQEDGAKKLKIQHMGQRRLASLSKNRDLTEEKKYRKLMFSDFNSKESVCYSDSQDSVLVSPFGVKRVLENGYTYTHNGADFRAYYGTPIYPIEEGHVVFTGSFSVPGNLVIVEHSDGIRSSYFHLSKILVQKGDTVSPLEPIGLSGNTGRSQAAHLHLETHFEGIPIDPEYLFAISHQNCQKMVPHYYAWNSEAWVPSPDPL
jgi:hypothetical protein